MQEGHQRKKIRINISEGDISTPRVTTRYYHRSGIDTHIGHMERNNRKTRNRKTIKYSLSSPNGRTDRANQWDTRTVSPSIYQLPTRRLGRITPIGGICIQQRIARNNKNLNILC